MECDIRTFNQSINNQLILNIVDKSNNFGRFIKNIKEILSNTSLLATNEEVASKDEDYISSVQDVITALQNAYKTKIKRDLTELELTDIDDAVTTVMTNQNLEYFTSYKDEQNIIFSPELKIANDTRKSDFRSRFSLLCIINTRKSVNNTNYKPKVISSSGVELNNAITSFLQEEFNTLYNFILTTDYKLKRKPVFSYTDGNDNISYINSKYTDVLELMRLYIKTKISNELTHEGSFYDELSDSYSKYILGRPDSETLLYRAVNAYLTLTHIDDVIKDTFGKNININQDLQFPNQKVKDKNNNIDDTKLKYSFNTNGNNQATHWGIEDHDSVKEMGNWSKSFIEAIQVKNHLGRELSRILNYLTPKDYLQAMTSMIIAGLKLRVISDNEMSEIFRQYAMNVVDNSALIKNMLILLFDPKKLKLKSKDGKKLEGNKMLLTNLQLFGLNDIHLDTLYSFYDTAIKGNSEHYSWLEVEEKSISLEGFESIFPIMNSLYSIAVSNVKMLYTQTTYNSDSEKTETGLKNNINGSKRNTYDRVNAVNNTNILLNNKDIALSLYSITRNMEAHSNKEETDYQYNVKISNSLSFVINASKKNTNGLLTHTLDSEKDFGIILSINGKEDIDLLGRLAKLEFITDYDVHQFINNNIDNEEARTLHSILSFVDTMLQTNFLSTVENFKEYTLYMLLSSNDKRRALQNLIVCSSRALLVNDIYNQFDKAVKKNGNKYTKFELPTFLNNNKDVYPEYNLGNLGATKVDSFYKNNVYGRHLQIVNVNATWVKTLADAHNIVTGEANSSTISFLNGAKYPNFSPYFKGMDGYRIFSYELNPFSPESASQFLLFSQGLPEILSISIDSEVRATNGAIKAVKEMNATELSSDKIINKFFGSLCDTGTMFSQPTVYADKHKPILYQVNLSRINLSSNISLRDAFLLLTWDVRQSTDDFNSSNTLSSLVVNKLNSTVGRFYRTIYNNVIEDYRAIWEEINKGQEFSILNLRAWLKTLKEQDLMRCVDLYNNHNTGNITLYKDVHYRKLKNGTLTLNELLYHNATELYNENNTRALTARINREQVNFANSLIEKNIGLRVKYNSNGLMSDSDTVSRYMKSKDVGILNIKPWLADNGSTIIIGKIINTETGTIRNVIYDSFTLAENERFVLNPALNNYFMSDVLLSSNLRLLSTGSEIAHKPAIISSKSNIRTDVNNALKEINLNQEQINELIGIDEAVTLQDLSDIMQGLGYENLVNELTLEDGKLFDNGEFRRLTNNEISKLNQEIENNETIIKTLNDVFQKAITAFESSGLIAQIKRNVSETATMNTFIQNTLQGVGKNINIAVVDDILGNVYNFSGDHDTIDACDGMSLESPLLHYLENNSLGENGTGFVKKPIHTWYNPRYGSTTLLKYAINVITNQTMRMSEGNSIYSNSNGISLYNLFKKMHNIRWNNVNNNGLYVGRLNYQQKVDLINGCDFLQKSLLVNTQKISFSKHILKGERLYYRDGNKHMLILNFGRTRDGIYYTIEQQTSNKGNTISDLKLIVFHLFSNDGTHYRIIKELNSTVNTKALSFLELNGKYEEGLHTIDSLYELHTALGGIYSESLFVDSNNEQSFLQYSEASLRATTNFITYVANAIDVEGERPLTQEGYYLPLKDLMIHQVAMNSAVKNGVGNINPTNVLYDTNNSLRFMTIDTKTYGIQLNSDHNADEAKMTEFSLVMSALDASAKYHDLVSSVYNMLGQVTILLSLIELEAVEGINDTNKSKLYDTVGRALILGFANKENRIGLGAYILKEISRAFNLNSDHALDDFKIPFSDSNIHSNILPTIIGTINAKSIKRQFPGLGVVIAGGKDMAMIYELDGKTYLYEDILKKALRDKTITSNLTDISKRNRDIVRQYLDKKQANIQRWKSTDVFNPEENIIIYYTSGNEERSVRVSLHDTDSYYKFKDNPTRFLFDTLIARKEIKPIATGLTDTGVITYSIINENNELVSLLFNPDLQFQLDVTQPRNLAPQRISFDYEKDGRLIHMNIFDTVLVKGLIMGDPAMTKEVVDKMMKELERGRYWDGTRSYNIVKDTYVNKPAEIIMSNLYKSKFGINDGDTLADIIDNGPEYFAKNINIPYSSLYALCYKREGNKDLYINFSPILTKNGNYRRRWNINKIAADDPFGRVKNRVFHMSDNNIRLFEVGREIVRNDLHYDTDKNIFLDNNNVEVKGNFINANNQVLEYIEFLSRYVVWERGKRREVYYINEKCFDNSKDNPYNVMIARPNETDESAKNDRNNFIATLLADIYKSEDFKVMCLNRQLTDTNYSALKGILKPLSTKFATSSTLRYYIYNPDQSIISLHSLYSKARRKNVALLNKNENIRNKEDYRWNLGYEYNNLINTYVKNIQKEVYSSFLKSLNFTVSRIPAQDLQSYMGMLNVAYTGIDNAHCYVSHWQFWLLGNDVDIDKAYCLGLSFDSNGKYVGWSDLFNYSSLETLTASEELPYPTKKKYEIGDSPTYISGKKGLYVDDYVLRLYDINSDRGREIDNAERRYGRNYNNEDLKNEVNKINNRYNAEEIKEYARFISVLNNNKNNTVTGENPVTYIKINETNNNYSNLDNYLHNTVIYKLRAHENTQLTNTLAEAANKNFISSHLQLVTGKLRNVVRAYTPLLMKETKAASALSRKSRESSMLTLMNPLAKYDIQYQALDGRNTVGIAANGLKASFIWHYFVNDIILNGNVKDIERVKFNFESKRIKNRKEGEDNIESVSINIIPDINLENVPKDKLEKLNLKRLSTTIDVGLILSEFISLATDNMKEMILPMINAGNKLMGVHLLLATLGFNIGDVVTFMTSDVISFIDAISDSNIFNNYLISIDNAINIARGNISSILNKFSRKTKGAITTKLGKQIKDIKIDDLLNKIDDIIYPYINDKSSYVYNELIQLNNILRFITNMRSKYNFDINNTNIKEDLDEFEKIYLAQKEFTLLGQVLALNQGLPTDKSALSRLTERLKKTYNDRVTQGPHLVDKSLRVLDIEKFIDNKDYQQQIIQAYNLHKSVVNIFDIITNVPQFSTILNLLSAEIKMDKFISIRSKAFNKITDLNPGILMSDKYSRNVLEQISGLIISSFITKKMKTLDGKNFQLPYKQNESSSILLLDNYAKEYVAPLYGWIKINNINDTGIFKYYFENTFIPMLKSGKYFITDPNTGNIIEKYDENIQRNFFIRSLILQEKSDLILYKLNADMNRLGDSSYGKNLLSAFLRGLHELSNIYIDGMSIADLFALYNLIVNKNYYGSDRLTAVFSDMVKTGAENSVLKQYFRYVGEIDNKARIRVIDDPNDNVRLKENEDVENVFDFYYMDALLGAASIVQSKWGQKDPFILINDSNRNLNLYRKDRYNTYSEYGESTLLDVANETMEQRVARLLNQRMYFVLSGPRMAKRSALLESIYTPNEHSFDSIYQLYQDGVIFITKDNTKNIVTIKVGNIPGDEINFSITPVKGAKKSSIITREDFKLLFNDSNKCKELAAKLDNFYYQNARKKALLTSYMTLENIAANCSFELLKEYFPTVHFEESDDVDILLVNNINLQKTNVYGRVILNNGRELFILENTVNDIKKFSKFISLRKKINANVIKFNEDNSEQGLAFTKMLKDIIIARNKLKNKPRISSINDLLLDFNYNVDNYTNMFVTHYETKLRAYVKLIMFDIIRAVDGLISKSYYHDDCLNYISNLQELRVRDRSNVLKLSELYQGIRQFYKESILKPLNIKSEKAFKEFFSSSGKDFLTKWKTEVIDKIGDIFPSYKFTIDLKNISDSDLKKNGYTFLWELIKSKDADFDYDVIRIELNDIIFKRNFLNVHEKYGIGYVTVNDFSNIIPEGYKGFKIYKSVEGKEKVYYYPSQLYKNSDMHVNRFETLEKAKKYIDNVVLSQVLTTHSFIDFYKYPTQGLIIYSELNIQTNTMFDIIDADINFDIGVEDSEKAWFNKNVALVFNNIKKYWNNLSDSVYERIRIDIENAELMAILLYKVNEYASQKGNKLERSDEIISQALDYLDSVRDKKRTLFVEKNKNYNKPRLYTYRVIEPTEDSMEQYSLDVRLSLPNTIIFNAIKEALKKLNVTVELKTKSEIEEMIDKDSTNLAMVDAAKTKAFIYNNDIYINTTIALSTDMFHEYGHLLLGVLQAKNMNNYILLLDIVNSNNHGKKIYHDKFEIYKGLGLTETAIKEEVFVELYSLYLAANTTLNEDTDLDAIFTAQEISDAFQSLFDNHVDAVTILNLATKSLNSIFKLFNNSVKHMLMQQENQQLNFKDALTYRKYSNWIAKLIREGKIKEKC